MPSPEILKDLLEKETTRIARSHGCDRGFFTVCWGEHEKGLTCRCKEEAKSLLSQHSIKE